MRESQVKGKLARFLAGMRSYERQQASGSSKPLPAVLSEFIAWAGDLLAGEEECSSGHGGGSSSGGSSSSGSSRGQSVPGRDLEARARVYVGGSDHLSSGSASVLKLEEEQEEEEDDWCCICLNAFSDTAVFEELGEVVQTVDCGHRFHAVCYACHLEASEQDPWCPMCRGGDLAVRFV